MQEHKYTHKKICTEEKLEKTNKIEKTSKIKQTNIKLYNEWKKENLEKMQIKK